MSNEIVVRKARSPAASGGDALVVRFVPEKIRMRQRRFEGRYVFHPDIDLSLFRAEAVLDYVQLLIVLANPTQFRWLFDRVDPIPSPRRPSIDQLNPLDPQNSVRAWTIKLQNITPRQVATYAKGLEDALQLAEPVRVFETEVSVDFYPKTPSDPERGRLVSVLRHTIFPVHAGRWIEGERARTSGGRGLEHFVVPHPAYGARTVLMDPQLHQAGPLDHTFYVGAEKGPWMVRVQDKTTDERTTIGFRKLEDHEKRARVEVTLRETKLREMGLDTVDRFLEFSVTRLQKEFFAFWLPGLELPSAGVTLRAAMNDWAIRRELDRFRYGGVLGLRWYRHLKKMRAPELHETRNRLRSQLKKVPIRFRPERADKNGTDIAYAALNEMVQAALKDLKDRMQRAQKNL